MRDLWALDSIRPILRNASLIMANLTNVMMTEASLFCADCRDAIFRNATLAGSKLIRAYLAGARLDNADFSRCEMGGSNLMRASLKGTVLTDALLFRAYLSQADLSAANLTSANLSGANVTGVDWSNTTVSETTLGKNIGMLPQTKRVLWERGAISITPLSDSSDKASSGSITIHQRQISLFDEVRSDLMYRWSDVEDALSMLEEAIATLRTAIEEHVDAQEIPQALTNQLEHVIAIFATDLTRFKQDFSDNRQALEDELTYISIGDIENWVASEFSLYLDEIHTGVLKLNDHTQMVYTTWRSLAEEVAINNLATS